MATDHRYPFGPTLPAVTAILLLWAAVVQAWLGNPSAWGFGVASTCFVLVTLGSVRR